MRKELTPEERAKAIRQLKEQARRLLDRRSRRRARLMRVKAEKAQE